MQFHTYGKTGSLGGFPEQAVGKENSKAQESANYISEQEQVALPTEGSNHCIIKKKVRKSPCSTKVCQTRNYSRGVGEQ